jgi:hypothetical protein
MSVEISCASPTPIFTSPDEAADSSEVPQDLDLDTAVSRVRNGDFDAISNRTARPVINRLRELQVECLSNANYDEADRLEAGIRRANHIYTAGAAESLNSSQTEELLNQLSIARYELAYFRSHWRKAICGASQRRDSELEEMQRQYDEELAIFDHDVKTCETPVPVRKYSPDLLQLRRRQKAMVASKRYIEAKVIKDEADRLEAKENGSNRERFREKAAADRKEMVSKQQEKLSIRAQNWDRTIQEMERIAEAELSQITKTIEHLETRIADKDEFARSSGWVEQSRDVQPTSTAHRKKTTGGSSSYSQMFKQQRMINKMLYSRVMLPKVKVPKTAR